MGPEGEMPQGLLAARQAMEERLFFEKFDDFIKAKSKVRESREARYGRENIIGVGIGWKNWPEYLRPKEYDYANLLNALRKRRYDPDLLFVIAHEFLHRTMKRNENFGKWCIRVLVNRKAPEKLVEPDVLVSTAMKESGFEFLTDVVEVGDVVLAMNNAVYRPVTCGVSGGHGLVQSGGTLGCVVTRRIDGKPLLLSCNHVVANLNNGVRHQDPVIQPSNEDNGQMHHKIGVLDDFIDLDFSGGINYVDAALVDIDPQIQVDPSMEGAGFIPKGYVSPRQGQSVKKVGRTTELRFGLVNGIHLGMQGVSWDIPYNNLSAKFSDIFSVGHIYLGVFPPEPFAAMGDSGSLIVEHETGNNHAVGLLFAVSEKVGDAYGCAFSRIDSLLHVTL